MLCCASAVITTMQFQPKRDGLLVRPKTSPDQLWLECNSVPTGHIPDSVCQTCVLLVLSSLRFLIVLQTMGLWWSILTLVFTV